MSKHLIAVGLAATIAGAAIAGLFIGGGLKGLSGDHESGTALVGGPFILTDHDSRPVTDGDYKGQYMLIYFGFAHCPDICPSALQVMSAALDEIGETANAIVPIFITVDPERDGVEEVKAYVSAFHPRMVGLTGKPEEVAKAAKAYRVYYRKVEDPGSSGSYTLDHTSIIYLMGPDGKFVTHFTHGTPLDVMSAKLSELVKPL